MYFDSRIMARSSWDIFIHIWDIRGGGHFRAETKSRDRKPKGDGLDYKRGMGMGRLEIVSTHLGGASYASPIPLAPAENWGVV
jgi:hypothetical protein